MSREHAHKSLSPRSPELWTIRSGPGDPLFISSVEWDDSCRREYFYCSVWLHLGGVRYLRWLQLLTSRTLLSCSAQLKRKFDFEGSVPFQLSNWPSKQFGMLPEMKLLEVSMANERPGWVLGWPMRGHSLRWALWCLDVIVSKHFGIEFVQLRRRRPLSAKYVVCPVQL